ncbi:MAG: YceI family protein [Sandaracinaceae bacterium]
MTRILARSAALAIVASLSLSMSAHARAQDASYRVAPDQSVLYVQVFKDDGTVGSGFAHDHVVRATAWSGRARFDPQRPSCDVEIRVPVAQLAVDEPAMRRRVGYDGDLDDDQRADVRESMLGEGQLDADAHPTIDIRVDRCSRMDEQRFRAPVTVTVRGHRATSNVVLRIAFDHDGRMRMRARFSLRHRDLGMEPYSAALGAVRNADPIRFVADLVLLPESSEPGGG